MKKVIFALSILLGFAAHSQQRLISSGEVPGRLNLQNAIGYLQTSTSLRSHGDVNLDEELEKLFTGAEYHIQELITDGYILFGDSISTYLNEVKSRLLENREQLNREIEVFTVKWATPNAFMSSRGRLFVTTGLISQVQNETELAFIIGHEIAHHFHDDMVSKVEEYLNEVERLEAIGSDKVASRMLQYSRDKELSADEFGIELLIESGYYDPIHAENIFAVLRYAYLPFEDKTFDFNWLLYDTTGVQITGPFPEEVNPISKSMDYDDSKVTHPNTAARAEAFLNYLVEHSDYEEKEANPFDPQRFHRLQYLSRRETIEADFQNQAYPRAIYEAYLMSLEYPNQTEELKLFTGYAMYVIASLKAHDDYNDFVVYADSIEGNSHPVYHFFENLSANEAAAIALRYNFLLNEDQGNDAFVSQFSDKTWYNFILLTESDVDDYRGVRVEEAAFDTLTDSAYALLSKIEKIRYDRELSASKVDKATWAAELFNSIENHPSFVSNVDRYVSLLDSNASNTSYSEELQRLEDLAEERFINNEPEEFNPIGIDSISIVHPFAYEYEKRKILFGRYYRTMWAPRYEESLEMRSQMLEPIDFSLNAFQPNANVVTYSDAGSNDYTVEEYNDYVLLSRLAIETYGLNDLPILPYSQRYLNEYYQNSGQRYVLYSLYRHELEWDGKPELIMFFPPVAVIGGAVLAFYDPNSTELYGTVYDIQNSEIVMDAYLKYQSGDGKTTRIAAFQELISLMLQTSEQ
ncbi:MAG: M48 family metalloprotease [Flavobacteriia bacterium]|nr:M48 family metalloprotease [Flavobacteriia bacterium]